MKDLKFRKLRADEIDVRVGRIIKTQNFQGVSLLLYKDARVDMQILDETVGALNWQRKHSRDNANCAIGIYDDEKKEWVWKEDTGTESLTEAEKGLASDSFKRAGTNWGIGRELYTAKNLIVACALKEVNGKTVPVPSGWKVKKIDYDEYGNITELIINEILKDTEKQVYALSKKQQQTYKIPPKTDEKERVMTLTEAENLTAPMKSGEMIKFKDLSDEQLKILMEQSKGDFMVAAKIILSSRAKKDE